MTPRRVASFGGGVNSTAMLIGMYERAESVDAVLFADTGGEKPETYQHVRDFSAWLMAHGMPEITLVREERFTLEQECITSKTLPSIVVGIRSCSDKFKIRPQHKWVKEHYYGEHIEKLIGFDAGEPWRVKDYFHDKITVRFPLVEWGWGREECIAAIQRHGLSVPPKSSCFFCPEMREWEIAELYTKHPELAERALAMERNNEELTAVMGLARKYSWQQIIDFHKKQQTLPILPSRIPCVCFDGEA